MLHPLHLCTALHLGTPTGTGGSTSHPETDYGRCSTVISDGLFESPAGAFLTPVVDPTQGAIFSQVSLHFIACII